MKKIFNTIIVLFCLTMSLSAMALLEYTPGTSKYIAAVLEIDGKLEVWINTREYWNENGCLIDSYPDRAEISGLAHQIGLCELQESVYEPCQPMRRWDLENRLIRMGIEIDSEFQKWAMEEIQ